MCGAACLAVETFSHFAPASIHFLMDSSSWAESLLPSMGMYGFMRPAVIRYKRLSSALPGTMTVPLFPPVRKPSSVSRSRVPIFTADAWQPEQYLAKIGATSVKLWAKVRPQKRVSAVSRRAVAMLVVEEKFLAGQQSPRHIFQRLAPGVFHLFRRALYLARSGDEAGELRLLLFTGVAAE